MCARVLLPHIERFRPDVILAYWIYPDGYGAARVGKQLGIPVVIAASGSDLRQIPDVFVKRLTRTALHRASYVITVSEELRQQAIQVGVPADRVRTILNGCDPSVFRHADREEARRELGIAGEVQLVLFVGRLVPLKGLNELLEAASSLAASSPQFRLVCIGEGPIEAKLRSRAAAPDLAGRVQFLGAIPPPQIARWLAAANLLCLPSHTEGCPNVVLEALYCGRPVVACNVGGVPELVDDTCAILVPPGCLDEIARAISAALGRSWDEAAIAARFRRTWEHVAEETYQVCLAASKEAGKGTVVAACAPSGGMAVSLPELISTKSDGLSPEPVSPRLETHPRSKPTGRRMIFNADDFGWQRGITDAILLAHRQGVITSASLMVARSESDYALQQARQLPNLSVGIHLNVSEGLSVLPAREIPTLVDAEGKYYRSDELRWRLWHGQVHPRHLETEFRAQIRWMKDRGALPSHADTHHSVHYHPWVMGPFRRALLAEGVYRMRPLRWRLWPRTGHIGSGHAGPFYRRWLATAYLECMQVIGGRNLKCPDARVSAHPAHWGRPELIEESWRLALAHLRPGTYELECHPGFFQAGFSETDAYCQRREVELRILTDAAFRLCIEQNGIELISYAQL